MLVGNQILLIFLCDASNIYRWETNFVPISVFVIMELTEFMSKRVLLSGYTTMELMILININK